MSKKALERMKSPRFQAALNDFRVAIAEMEQIVGADNFNFVGSITVFNDFENDIENKGDFENDGITWSIGYNETNICALECLIEELRKEVDNSSSPGGEEK